MDEQERDWLKLVYEQAWEQYTHEDEMAEQRDTKYLTILSIFITAIGVLVSMLVTHIVDKGTIFQSSKSYVLSMLAMIAVVTGLILRFIDNWKRVTAAAERYINMRLKTIREIEAKVGFQIRLAEEEENKKEADGFSSTQRIINIIARVSWLLLILAIASGVAVIIFI